MLCPRRKAGSCASLAQSCKVALLVWVLQIAFSGSTACQVHAIDTRIPPPGAERKQPEAAALSPSALAPQGHVRSVRQDEGHQEGQRVRTHGLTATGVHYCIAFLSHLER